MTESADFGDAREQLFSHADWFEDLREDTSGLWTAWRVTKSDDPAWWKDLLNAAAIYAQRRNVIDHYRTQIAGIGSKRLHDRVSDTEGRSPVFPIWEIVNELIVAVYLEAVCGWEFRAHEPSGRQQHVGDWEFTIPRTGDAVFVEVKSLEEPVRPTTGVYSRPDYTGKLRSSVLKGAYRQLPMDGRRTLVVVVGRHITDIGHGIMYGDLFQALYGKMQITFDVMPYDPESVKAGPSFRDRFVHSSKHRRLGVAAGLSVSGLDHPGLGFYAIHNPWAHEGVQMGPDDFPGVRQFHVTPDGRGRDLPGEHPKDHWAKIRTFLYEPLGGKRRANGR